MNKAFWRGVPIETLSREELEAAFCDLLEKWNALYTPEECRARAVGHVELWRREARGR